MNTVVQDALDGGREPRIGSCAWVARTSRAMTDYLMEASASPSSSTISGVVAQLHMKRTVPSMKR